jgi:RNA-directed DNA polymerase
MSKLQKLNDVKSLDDFAELLGYKASSLAYLLYKTPQEQKYTAFKIPKKSGGEREILAPNKKLKRLQKILADLLYDCMEELRPEQEKDNRNSHKKLTRQRASKSVSHGFQKGLSIASNAECHLGKRYVFNLDIENFFPSINFGRIRGFFIKNRSFKLSPAVATIIAQIASHENALPQGSPCSPIISNLIAQILDVHLSRLARKHGCMYSRYADDLTFSTNKKEFPKEIAIQDGLIWRVGDELAENMQHSGFVINAAKTRMQYKLSRQVVTGIVVNKEVNPPKDYYRSARAMCHALFSHGTFHNPTAFEIKGNDSHFWLKAWILILAVLNSNLVKLPDETELQKSELGQLQGILNYIYFLKNYKNKHCDERDIKSPDGIKKLYSNFLFFKNFYQVDRPVIFCEGKTDKIYIKCALNQLATQYPSLVKTEDGKKKQTFRFFNHTDTLDKVMNLAPGTSGMKFIILSYERIFKRFQCKGKRFPVIILIDNDSGAKPIYSVMKKLSASKTDVSGDEDFYHVCKNLYVVPTPKINGKQSKIEDFFDKATLATKIDGKTFNAENTPLANSNQYGKQMFATKVIQQNAGTINFQAFAPLLDRVVKVISHYEALLKTQHPITKQP